MDYDSDSLELGKLQSLPTIRNWSRIEETWFPYYLYMYFPYFDQPEQNFE